MVFADKSNVSRIIAEGGDGRIGIGVPLALAAPVTVLSLLLPEPSARVLSQHQGLKPFRFT